MLSSGRTCLLRHQYPEKKRQLTNCWHFSATKKNAYTYEIKKKEKNEGRSKGRAGGKNLANRSLSVERRLSLAFILIE